MPRAIPPQHRPPKWMRKGKMIGMINGKWDPNIYFPNTRKRKVRLAKQWEDIAAFEAAVRAKDEKAQSRLSRSIDYIVQNRLKNYFEKHASARTHYDDAYGHVMRYAIKKYIAIVEKNGIGAANAILSRKLLGYRNIAIIIQQIPKVEQPGYNLVSASTRKKTTPLSRAHHLPEPLPLFPREVVDQLRENMERTSLSAREKRIIKLHYGFDAPALQLTEIGKQLKLTRQRIHQILEQALSRLRQSKNLKALGLASSLDDYPRPMTKKPESTPKDMQRRGGAHPIFTNIPALLNPAPPPKRPAVSQLAPAPPALTSSAPAAATKKKKKPAIPRVAKPKTIRTPKALPVKRIAKPPKPKRPKKTALQQSFARMSPLSRRVAILFYLRGFTFPQVVQRLRINEKEAAKALEGVTRLIPPEAMQELNARTQTRRHSPHREQA